MIHFHNPFYLLGLLLVALLYFFLGRREKPSILYSDTSWLGIKPLNKFYANLSEYLLLIVLAFIFLALTRPQRGYESEIIEKKGIDIVLTLDVSGSMRAVDFKPNNRLTVAKKLASEFVQKRAGDRIGLVAYAREALIQSPLTLDHKVVKDLIESLDFGMLEDGTAIGM
ncbi:MAG: VWA domain-containing protein, partial [candidate division WOR-3 bacterium]|nr:VWA domain-containing protein [candidate division WOR-3 bacterium]